jgi:hypothetical protein
MLAERFLPQFFDQMASAAAVSPNGDCTDVAALEVALKSAADKEELKMLRAYDPKADKEGKRADRSG